MPFSALPARDGLYDPLPEHDACGGAMVATLRGTPGHDIVKHAITALVNLDHRGATGADPLVGAGASLLMQVPDRFFREVCGVGLPAKGRYLAGFAYLPQNLGRAADARAAIARLAEEEGLEVLGWRQVPTRPEVLGQVSRDVMPSFWQVFLTTPGRDVAGIELDRLGFALRKRAEHSLDEVYFPLLSARTHVYKGMLTTAQLAEFFPDLSDERVETELAVVHSRFSTNTFPSWTLAHPFRMIAHNSEINTVMGNRNTMRARESLLESDLCGGDMARLFPICTPGASDSASFDEVLELLHLGGRSLPHAVLMMIPEAGENHATMDPKRRACYQFHAMFMEAWDGPAAVTFTDGTQVGAVLDRNGLRPSRFWVTDDGLVVLGSEAGLLDIEDAKIVRRGRVAPGRMFLVVTAAGRIVEDEEIKSELAAAHPYEEYVADNGIRLSDRDCDADRAPIRSRLLASAVHHHLVRTKDRMKVSLIVEAGDVREVHHVATLIGFGASAVNPYLAMETVEDMVRRGAFKAVSAETAARNVVKALGKGLLKVMSKMGISTVASYRGAQTFECLAQEVREQDMKPVPELLRRHAEHTGSTVAAIGSGPSGLAAAQQLTRAGHTVAVFERADKPGGLLRYGIPEFKMEKAVLDRRLAQMRAEGTRFRTGVNVGVDLTGRDLQRRYDAVVLTIGATRPRGLAVPGADLNGVHQAMEYLPQSNRVSVGQEVENQIVATGKDVVIIGGGDTGADCLGTALRQGARSVTSLEIMPQPGPERPAHQPWPTYPMSFRVASAHEEGGERKYSGSTKEVIGDDEGNVSGLRVVEVTFADGKFVEVEGTEHVIPAQLVLLAMGFLGPQTEGIVEQLGVEQDERGNLARDENFMTNVPGVVDGGWGAAANGEGPGGGVTMNVRKTLLGNVPARAPELPVISLVQVNVCAKCLSGNAERGSW